MATHAERHERPAMKVVRQVCKFNYYRAKIALKSTMEKPMAPMERLVTQIAVIACFGSIK
ncbi:hypothetical protein [Janthinobacterium sp. RB2R34]|uniref:hypothetical protein n=1 Tax=Janthinobacterium sp. RB2R34 TaxID=3424193 RepID=UPI003F523860